MALEIPERAVVGHDLEAVAQGLRRGPGGGGGCGARSRGRPAARPAARPTARPRRCAPAPRTSRPRTAARPAAARCRRRPRAAAPTVRRRRPGDRAPGAPPSPAPPARGAPGRRPTRRRARLLHLGDEELLGLDLVEDHPPVGPGLGQRVRQQVERAVHRSGPWRRCPCATARWPRAAGRASGRAPWP